MRVIGLAGWSGAGKTTLIVRLIPELKARGLSVSTLKHAHHNFDVDQPGKDSFRHREAGAHEVLIASSNRFALMHELRGAPEPPLATLIAKLEPVDLVIIEGFKADRHAKLEVHRAENGKPFIFPDDANIKAIASDGPNVGGLFKSALPYAHLDDIPAIADLVLKFSEPLDETLRQLSASR
jgi:molybdopterin-guanine dinucleotide biosynthesis protein B